MRRIRSVDTQPELRVRSLVHSMGFRFRLHRRDLPGTPDLVFPRFRKVILVHGCFWHQHFGCTRAFTPKTHGDYWLPKLRHNREKDEAAAAALAALGWDVLVIWECETTHAQVLVARLHAFLGGQTRGGTHS
jgi:DNA mismatch endonuclease, patch repair protein